MKRILRYLLISFVIAFIGAQLGGLLIDYQTPDFMEEIQEKSKSDENLMKKIGGYKTFEYNYNENELKGDSMNFKIIIYGHTKNLIYTGYSLREKNKDWEIKKIKTLIE